MRHFCGRLGKSKGGALCSPQTCRSMFAHKSRWQPGLWEQRKRISSWKKRVGWKSASIGKRSQSSPQRVQIHPGWAIDGAGEKKGVLCPHRCRQSDLFTLKPSGHTREPPWPEIFSCQRSAREGLERARKRKKREGRTPPKDKRGSPSPFWARMVRLAPSGASDPFPEVTSAGGCHFPQEVLELLHQGKF